MIFALSSSQFDDMSVAVLIPTFKPGDYLESCLRSLNTQTLDKGTFTVYICLNGEREPYESNIRGILSTFSFNYRYIYISQSSVSNARNILMKESTEDYIVFIDDDDLISPDYLKELLNVTNAVHMGIARVYNFKATLDEKTLNYIGRAFELLHDQESSKFKTRRYFSSPCGKMLHRDMISDKKFDVALIKGEDSLFMATISPGIMKVVKTSNSASYYVRERPGSVTRKEMKLSQELRILIYLLIQYLKLLFSKNYNKIFILTRIAATTLKFFKKSSKIVRIVKF
jgi:glycosyltransferase involved in cell wall biosynthesis